MQTENSHWLLQLTNIFQSCYLQSDTQPTVDPRIISYCPQYVLDPPSLKDVSKTPIPEVNNQLVRSSWGEAAVQRYEHEFSTDSSHDREESVSEASQSVAAESVVRAISFVSFAFPSFNNDGVAVIPDSPSTIAQTTTPSSTANESSGTHAPLEISPQEMDLTPVPGVVDPTLSTKGGFIYPKCPREFVESGKAR